MKRFQVFSGQPGPGRLCNYDFLLLVLLVILPVRISAEVATRGPRVLASFESPEEIRDLFPEGGRVVVSREQGHATQGKWSARLSFPPYNPKGGHWPSIKLLLEKGPNAVTDWREYRRVSLEVSNPAEKEREFGISFLDQDGKSAGYSYWKVPGRGTTTISFRVPQLSTIDLSRMQAVGFWQRLQLRRPLDRTVFYVDHVRLYSKQLDGQAVSIWFDTPHFRDQVFAGEPPGRIVASIGLDLPAKSGVGEIRAELAGPEGKLFGVQKLDPSRTRQTVEFPFPPSLPARGLVARVILFGAEGKALFRKEAQIRVVPPGAEVVSVDAQNHLRVNGRPFFPIGIYNAPVDDFALLAELGFNCVGPYLEGTPDIVAEARKRGLRLICNAPKPGQKSDWFDSAALSGTILAYYVYDEPAPDRAEELRSRCLELARADPYHPTCGCNNLHHAYYTDVADIMMVDAYPMPGKFDVIIDRMKDAVSSMKGRRPVWYIPQIFGRIGYMHSEELKSVSKEQTFDQERAAIWLGVALGARGIVCYSHRIQTFRIRYAFPLLWKTVGFVARELRALHDTLLWKSGPLESSAPEVYARAFVSGGKVFIVAVNAGRKPLQADLFLPRQELETVQVLGEGRTVQLKGKKLTDRFQPQSAHLYVSWDLAWPLNVVEIRDRLSLARSERERRLSNDVALFYKGATLSASWGFPPEARSYPWLRMIDGYRGTTWPRGARGMNRDYRFPKTIHGPNRWVEVEFAQKEKLDKAVVITSGLHYQFATWDGANWKMHRVEAEEQTAEYSSSATVRTFLLKGIETDRVRLLIPAPPQEDEREVFHEIEVYRLRRPR